IQERLLRRKLEQDEGRSRMRNVLTLIKPGILFVICVDLLWTDTLPVILVLLYPPNDLVGHHPGHQDEGLEPAINTAQKRSDSGVVTVAHESNPFAVDV